MHIFESRRAYEHSGTALQLAISRFWPRRGQKVLEKSLYFLRFLIISKFVTRTYLISWQFPQSYQDCALNSHVKIILPRYVKRPCSRIFNQSLWYHFQFNSLKYRFIDFVYVRYIWAIISIFITSFRSSFIWISLSMIHFLPPEASYLPFSVYKVSSNSTRAW